MSQVFICYRRKDTFLLADRIKDRLTDLGYAVFMDVKTVKGGDNWVEAIEDSVKHCDVMLVLIDRNWLSPKLSREQDFVRHEIRSALGRGIAVIPVLWELGDMPEAADLPDDIRELYQRSAVKITLEHVDKGVDDVAHRTASLVEMGNAFRRERESFHEHWDGGDWQSAASVLEKMKEMSSEASCPMDRGVLRKEALLARLESVRLAIEQGRLAEAEEQVKTIDRNQSPKNLDYVASLVDIGLQVESATRERRNEAVAELERAFEKLVEEARGKKILILPGEREVRGILRTALQEARYQSALDLFDEGRFSLAAKEFAELAGYRDSSQRLETSEAWLTFYSSVREKDWETARSILGGLPSLHLKERVRGWRQWVNWARRYVPVLERMASCPLAPEPRFCTIGLPGPYETLELSPEASSKVIQDVLYSLQGQSGGVTAVQRNAWDALRRVENRLIVDFGLYRVRSCETARELIHKIESLDEESDAEVLSFFVRSESDRDSPDQRRRSTIGERLGEDAGVFQALIGDYDRAIRHFSAQARANPDDPEHLHHLGLAASARLASNLDEETELMEVLDQLVFSWAAVLACDAFWHRWWAARKSIYGKVTNDQVQKARQELKRLWVEHCVALSDRNTGAEAGIHAEINGARAVNGGGGLPLDGKRKCVLGRMGTSELDVGKRVAPWTESFGTAALEEDGWQRRVCLYFSELGEPLALFELGQYRDAISLLDDEGSGSGGFETVNPGFSGFKDREGLLRIQRAALLEKAHFKVGISALSERSVDSDTVISHWRESLSLSELSGRRPELESEVRQLVIGRAASLRNTSVDDRDQALECMNDAVTLLQKVLREGWDDEEGSVRSALVGSLLDRAILLSVKFDAEQESRDDARRARSMDPESLRCLTTFCFSSLHYTKQLFVEGKKRLAEAVLREVEECMQEGKRLYPENPDLQKVERNFLEVRDLVGQDEGALLEQALGDLQDLETLSGGSPQKGVDLASAMVLEAQGEFQAATEAYWALARGDETDTSIRGKLALCYRAWIIQLQREGADPGRVKELVEEALSRCPGSPTLSDLQEEYE